MSIIRDPQSNGFNLIEHTDIINEIDRQYQIFDDALFDTTYTNQTAVLFDVNSTKTTLVPAIERGAKNSVYGSDDVVQTRALPLAYFKASDYITSDDLLSQRRRGTDNQNETLDLVRADKLTKLRRQLDQTVEWLKLQAVKGVFKTPQGTVIADLFDEFGVAQTEVNFELDDNTTDVLGKVRQLRRLVREKLTNGGFYSGLDVYTSPEFFDALISHASVKEAYKYYVATDQARGGQPLRDNLNDVFDFGGVRFISLDGSFALPNGTSDPLVEEGIAHVVPKVNGLFRSVFGSSNKLELVTRSGQEMFAWEYMDPQGEYLELQAEMAPLMYCTRPAALIKLKAEA